MSITISSPGGHTVEVADLNTFVEKYPDVPRKSYNYLSAKLPILKALWYEGSFGNASGMSTGLLHAAAVQYGYSGQPATINSKMHQFEKIGVVSRKINGRRCFGFNLLGLPDTWYNLIVADEEPVTEKEVAEIFTETYDDAPVEPLGPDVTAQVAAALLQQCVDIINAGGNVNADEMTAALQHDVHALELRLGDQVACYQTASRKLKETQDELFAVKQERDALRKTVRRLEQNIEAFKNPAIETYIRDRVSSEVDKTMRESPRSH